MRTDQKKVKKNKRNHETPIIAKCTDWDFSKRIKSEFIGSAKNGNSQIFVTQIFSAALTSRLNAAVMVRRELKTQDPTLQGYLKYPAILMIKKQG